MWEIDSYISYFSYIGLCSFVLFLLTKIILGKSVETKGDFFEHQRLAQKKVKWLYLVFLFAMILIFATSYGILLFMIELVAIENMQNGIKLAKFGSIILVIIIVIAYLINSSKMSKNSINEIAKILNADELLGENLNPNEKILLNVVEEMAIASQMQMPRIFVLRGESSINAMCSGEYLGTYKERFAIFVTQGALDTFDRDELQGVIGHEFSHIFHDDVEINMKLISIIFAMSCISMIGKSVFKSSGRGRSKNKGAIFACALALIVIGFVGSTFGRIIQSAISRQKEFLADASSVQYTRNPDGIKEALRKIAQSQNIANSTHISNANATPYAHMFFLPSFATLFATHPSIKERLKRLKNIRL